MNKRKVRSERPTVAADFPPAVNLRWWSRPWFIVLLLAAFTLAVYWPVLRCDFISIDDDVYVTGNRHVLPGLSWGSVDWAFSNLTAGFWQPLTWLSHMLDCQLYGLHAWGHHLTNLLLHTGSTVLLFLTLRRMTGALWRSAMVAGLFALHPLHVEPVAWVAERKEVLSAFFGFLSLLFYARYVQKAESGKQKAENRLPTSDLRSLTSGLYWLSLFFFACGLMSKPMLVTLPVVMLLLDYWPLQRISDFLPHRGTISDLKRLVVEKIPFLLLGLFAGLVTIHAEHQLGALPTAFQYILPVRVANALFSSARYLTQMVWPTGLANIYLPPVVPAAPVLTGAIFLLLVISLGAAVWWRRFPFLAVGWSWYVVTLLPVSGLIQICNNSRADRYTYVPLTGIFILLVWGAGELLTHWRSTRVAAGIIGAAVLMACATVTWHQLGYWRNSETLCRHSLAVTGDNTVAYYALGTSLQDAGRVDEAIENYLRCLRLTPFLPAAHHNLGVALVTKGRLDEALGHFQLALRYSTNDAPTYGDIGFTLVKLGRPAEAIGYFNQALRLAPDDAAMHEGLAQALSSIGKTSEAARQYQLALQLTPDSADAQINLGIALAQQGQLDEAAEHFRAAIHGDPANAAAYNSLGNIYVLRRQFADAVPEYEAALRLQPDYAEAHNGLGYALAGLGRLDDAVAHYREAMRLQPDYAVAHFNLGSLLAQRGDRTEAIAQFREALRLQPDYDDAKQKLRELGVPVKEE